MQSRAHSFIEAAVNIFIGFLVAMGSQIIIFGLYGVKFGLETHAEITLWFTGVSLIRSYVLRRIFTNFTERSAK